MFPHSHNFSDGQLGAMIAIDLPVLGGLGWLYNAYRLGKLRWKPTKPANPRLACLVILLGILLAGVLLAILE